MTRERAQALAERLREEGYEVAFGDTSTNAGTDKRGKPNMEHGYSVIVYGDIGVK